MNLDHAHIRAFLDGGTAPMAITSNALAQMLGGQFLEADGKAGTVTLAFEPGPQFQQGAGLLQGGIVAAMLDFGMAFALMTRLADGANFGTASMTVNYLKPAPAGRWIVRGRVTRLGARIAFAEAEMQGEGKSDLTATASSVLPLAPKI
jgi:uncharacterized protein (TIGR00369 family)